MNCFSICSVTVKSAMTPSFIGRIAVMLPGVRPEHLLRREADFLDHALAVGPAFLADRDDRRLVQHDALAAHVDQRVGGAEVDREVAGEVTFEELEHESGSLTELRTAQRERGGPRTNEAAALLRKYDDYDTLSRFASALICARNSGVPAAPSAARAVRPSGDPAADRARRRPSAGAAVRASPMALTLADVHRIAHLARIEIDAGAGRRGARQARRDLRADRRAAARSTPPASCRWRTRRT